MVTESHNARGHPLQSTERNGETIVEEVFRFPPPKDLCSDGAVVRAVIAGSKGCWLGDQEVWIMRVSSSDFSRLRSRFENMSMVPHGSGETHEIFT